MNRVSVVKSVRDQAARDAGRRITQRDFAESLGVSASLINALESGGGREISLDFAGRVFRRYGKWIHSSISAEEASKMFQRPIPDAPLPGIQIERDIPIPPRRNQAGGNSKYPLAQLKVGESYFVRKSAGWASIQQAAYLRAKTLGIKITTRRVDNGVRVWRIE